MDIRYKLFPYPVLSSFSDDYVDTAFVAEVRAIRDLNDIVFHFDVLIDNKGLVELINNGKAEYAFHIECPYTSYRSIICTEDVECMKRIQESKLNGKVAVCPFIVVKEDLRNYINTNFNSDYGNVMFNIEKGGILAIGNQTNITITKETEEITKIPSIFSILRRDTDDDIGMNIELTERKINLWLCNSDFHNYRNAANAPEFLPLLHSSLVLPALIYAFETLRNNGIEEYENARWFKAIERTLSTSHIKLDTDTLDERPSFELAQKLLALPISRGLRSILTIGTEEEDI